jgi:hypothetical protein
VPRPRTCPISCSATLKKSVSVELSPDVVVPKNQGVAPLSNAIDPPQGPKLVGVAARAPVCPRAATVLSHAWSPVALKPPVLPSPASPPLPSERPPT